MIVLFIKSDLIRAQPLPEWVCKNCHKTGGMAMELRQRYADFAGGKVYPKGVFGVVQCSHCGHTLPASRWTDDLHRAFVALKADYRTPATYWKGAITTAIGFAVGTLLIVGVLQLTGQKQRDAMARDQITVETVMKQPKSGVTLATTDGTSGLFDVWRVGRVEGNTVWLRKYKGSRKLTNFYAETDGSAIRWSALPDSDFDAEGVAFSKAIFAQKGLKRIEDEADKSKRYEGYIMAVLK